jgi:Leucine-rich repeat (LRR) protein
MSTPSAPFHQAQITRSLPAWTKTLHPDHTRRLMRSLRKDYLDDEGAPQSWYATATAEQQARLRLLIGDREASFQALGDALKGLKDIRAFCKPLLETRLGQGIDVERAQYVHQPYEMSTNTWAGPLDLEVPIATDPSLPDPTPHPVGQAQRRSLLEAALHNFEGLDDLGPFDRLTSDATSETTLAGLEPAAFVRHCRQLNLGEQYQDHLQSIYESPQKAEIERLFIHANIQALNVQVAIAAASGLLTNSGIKALIQLCNQASNVRYGDHALRCWRMSLFGIPIHDILLFGPDASDQVNPCIVYIPNDGEQPLREYPSLSKAGDALRKRLVKTEFRRHLVSFAYKSSQAELTQHLETALFQTDTSGNRRPIAKPVIAFTTTQLASPIWPTLFKDHVLRLKADARTVAIPTADADANARAKMLQHWRDIGLNVLNVAAFFVPGLDAAMLGVFAYQVASTVFTGFEAWEDGDTHEAINQLESLAIDAAMIAGTAIGAKVLKASGFVDALQSVWKDGQEVLWHADMHPYVSTRTLAQDAKSDALGHYLIDDKPHVRLDDKLYEVFQDAEQRWRVRHPSQANAYAPLLEHLGEGRWQLAHEQPLDWSDAKLLRRLGKLSDAMTDTDLDKAMHITGTRGDCLRRIQVAKLPLPPLLSDTLQQLQLDDEVTRLIDKVRDNLELPANYNYALPELLKLPGWPQDYALKVFMGAEPWGEASLYGPHDANVKIELTRTDLENGKLSETVVAQMHEADLTTLLTNTAPEQRASALSAKLADNLQSKRSEMIASLKKGLGAPLSKEAQTLAGQFKGLPDSACETIASQARNGERIQLKAGRVPLRLAEEARLLQARARLDRAVLGLYRANLASADSQTLLNGLRTLHPQVTDDKLLDVALGDRDGCARLLGQQPIKPGFRSPLRLANGQLGYPLSGRGGASLGTRTAMLRLRDLYPELSRQQLREVHDALARNGDLGVEIANLQKQRHTLERELNKWVWSAADLDVQLNRQQFAELIQGAARREGGSELMLQGMTLPQLPKVSATLGHVRTLKLIDLQLQQLESDFLANFPNLETLEVSGNPEMNGETLSKALKSVPKLRELHLPRNGLAALSSDAQQALEVMRNLRILNLGSNNLQLDRTSLHCLTRLPLDVLRLNNNNITLDADLSQGFQRMIHPQTLVLSHNPLQLPPDISNMARLNHLNLNMCRLQVWPEGLTRLMTQPQYQLRHLDLSNNALHTVPELATVLNTPYAHDVARRQPERLWHFNYNTLEASTRTQLRASGVAVLEEQPNMPDWQLTWRNEESEEQNQLWLDLFEQGENSDLLGVLERLTQSAEARDDAQALSERVWAMLAKAAADTALRERLNEVAEAFPPTCGDAGADAFSALEIEVMVYDQAGHTDDNAKDLLALYRKLYRREKVNELADRISLKRTLRKQALQDDLADWELPGYDVLDEPFAFPDDELITGLVDDVEVRLALRQSLASRLDYPEPSRRMLYRDTANITPTIIDRVGNAVRELDANDGARYQWMIQQPRWVQYLKKHYAGQFEAVTDFWRAGHDYLFHCLDESNDAVTRLDQSVVQTLTEAMPQSPLGEHGALRRVVINDGAFEKAMKALSAKQQQVEDGLLLSLTRQLETVGH